MKDSENNFEVVENNDFDSKKEVNENVSHDIYNIKSEENNNSQFEEKRDNTFEKSENTFNQKKEYLQATETNNNVGQQSAEYYYSQSFDNIGNSQGYNFDMQPVAPKKKSAAGKIILSISLAVVGSLLLFFIAFMILGTDTFLNGLISSNGNQADLGDESMDIIQNGPQISINQNDDPSYVPQSLPEVVKKIGASVVEITTESRVSDRFYGQYVTSGAGSGVIVSQSTEAGYLITNYHVIYNDKDKVADTITITLTNGDEYKASVLGGDKSLDLAVIRIEKKSSESFTVANFGDSSKLVVGQDIIAIGNPLGSLGGTVTDGIISALDRKVKVEDSEMILLQHNAAINPGNSGGGLFDMMGNLVGVVNAKTSETGIEGLGFAIPSNIALNFFRRIMIIEPTIGIRVTYGSLRNEVGVYVTKTTNSNFKINDKIVSVNGTNVVVPDDYYSAIDSCKSGDKLIIKVNRNRSLIDITVTIP